MSRVRVVRPFSQAVIRLSCLGSQRANAIYERGFLYVEKNFAITRGGGGACGQEEL